ncbi:MAG: prepilin-type N-terminal cleavage/methylation domain-containing protein [Parcubacteria group bacterium]|jgi:prepilin-type N-terminal cleavage/methylation domain-containing protein
MKIKNKNGFSFIEVLISVFVLSIGITAAITLMAGNIKNSIDSRDSIIASELAQEGVELIRNVRDNNFLTNPEDVFNGFANDDCIISYNSNLSCGGSLNYALNYNSGYYTHSGGDATKFLRRINITSDPGGSGGKLVTSTTWWNGNSDPPVDCNMAAKCIYVENILTDWKN